MGHKRKIIIFIIITKALDYSKKVIHSAHYSPTSAQPARDQWPLTSFPLAYMMSMTSYAMEYHFGVSYSDCVPS